MCCARWGHGDEIVIVDANYPPNRRPQVIRLDAFERTEALDVVLSVFPLDTFVPDACVRMEVVGKASKEQPIFDEFRAADRQTRGSGIQTA